MPLELFPYQVQGAAFLTGMQRAGLHDEMGVGKTAQVIRAMDEAGLRRGIIGCPAFLRSNWVKEFRLFAKQDRRLCRARNIHDYIAWSRGKYDVLISSYELLAKWAAEINAAGDPLDVVAVDEAHYLKNHEAKRTKALLGAKLDHAGGIAQDAWRFWHVTGTPMANDPMDLYTFMRAMGAMDLSPEQFKKRYFKARPGRFGVRHSPLEDMVPELQAFLNHFAIRRLQKDVYPELPACFLTDFTIEGDTENIRKLLAEYPGLSSAIIAAVEAGGVSMTFLDAQHIGTLRRLVGEAKVVPYAYSLVDEIFQGCGKRVVYGIHVDTLRMLRSHLTNYGIKSVIVQGGVSDKDRDEAVRAFQADEDCRVFIGNIRAAGVGITLTASCEIDILEADWSPAGNAQALKRVHRIGQMQKVRGRFITLANSIDETVNKIVAEKTAAIAMVEGVETFTMPVDFRIV